MGSDKNAVRKTNDWRSCEHLPALATRAIRHAHSHAFLPILKAVGPPVGWRSDLTQCAPISLKIGELAYLIG